MSSQRRPPRQTQPKTYKPTLQGILSLPYRLCNPPHAVGKVRSCGVTPVFKVRLEDILDRKHLPPLGLKDFEEWLLYVEQCPENLYFILWLKEYTLKYKQWAVNSKPPRNEDGAYHVSWPVQSSSQLAMFYARAKQTFFTPNSDYELNVPSDILAPFHSSNGSPHPDPAVFAEVACEAQKMLQESLERFVIAAYNNVGNNRVMCGMIAGVFIALAGSIAPIVYNFTQGNSRWLRLAALPGLWMGLTILLASLHGVCMGVYIFGDLRQLRKFELSRPPISRPQPLTAPRPRPVISSPLSEPPVARPPILPITQPPRLSIISPPPQAHVRDSNSTLTRTPSVSSSSSFTSSSISSEAEAVIHISQAYYDDEAIEGPATSPISTNPNYQFPTKVGSDDDDTSFAATASFIHPFDPLADDDYDYDGFKHSPEERQPISPFDFDALPSRTFGHSIAPPTPGGMQQDIIVIQQEPTTKRSLRALIARIQARCGVNKWQIAVGMTVPDPEKNHSRKSSFDPTSQHQPHHLPQPRRRAERSDARVRTQFKLVKAVPAFASPLTRVLSPVVVRGQWEIVVRSSMIAFVISWVVLGTLLAAPVVG